MRELCVFLYFFCPTLCIFAYEGVNQTAWFHYETVASASAIFETDWLHYWFFLPFFVFLLFVILNLVKNMVCVCLRLCVGTDTAHTRRLAGSIPANRLVSVCGLLWFNHSWVIDHLPFFIFITLNLFFSWVRVSVLFDSMARNNIWSF
uniref:Uncharacterized protein ORF147 n=1 Tax=Euplotes crassus TaxID=5936 RepID=D1LDS7_EUPCR|nr:hypothetical protein [Moneuplotes crassus]